MNEYGWRRRLSLHHIAVQVFFGLAGGISCLFAVHVAPLHVFADSSGRHREPGQEPSELRWLHFGPSVIAPRQLYLRIWVGTPLRLWSPVGSCPPRRLVMTSAARGSQTPLSRPDGLEGGRVPDRVGDEGLVSGQRVRGAQPENASSCPCACSCCSSCFHRVSVSGRCSRQIRTTGDTQNLARRYYRWGPRYRQCRRSGRSKNSCETPVSS